MLRPRSTGSFTAADHTAVIDAAIAQLPPQHRVDVLVTVDGARASHGLVDHLTGLNPAAMPGPVEVAQPDAARHREHHDSRRAGQAASSGRVAGP